MQTHLDEAVRPQSHTGHHRTEDRVVTEGVLGQDAHQVGVGGRHRVAEAIPKQVAALVVVVTLDRLLQVAPQEVPSP